MRRENWRMAISKKKMRMYGLSIRTNRSYHFDMTGSGKWIQKQFCGNICSENTLIAIEKGKAGRYEDFYEEFAKKLKMRIADDPKVDRKIETYTKRIYHAVEYYHLDEIEKYTNKSAEMLEPYQDCLWYGDLYKAVCALRDYYMNQKMVSREDRVLLSKMIGEFSEQWDDMIKSIVFCSAFHDLESDEYEKRFEEFGIERNKAACNQVNTLMYYSSKEYTRRMHKLYETLEKEWQEKKNYIRLIDLYSSILVYNSHFDVTEVNDVRKKIEQIIDETEIPKYKAVEVFYTLGSTYYSLGEYKKAIAMLYNTDRTKYSFMLIGHMQRKNGSELSIPEYSEEDLSKFSKDIQLMYEYFVNVNKITAKESEKFLMKTILPKLNKTDSNFVAIMREELEMLVEETKHYKDLMTFNKRVKINKSHDEES